MEKRERITIVICEPTSAIENDKELFPESGVLPVTYLGHLPYYYLNNTDEYLLFCLAMVFQKSLSVEAAVQKTKLAMRYVIDTQKSYIILCVESNLLYPLISELENEASGVAVEYFVIDPVEFPEVKTSRRRIVTFDVNDLPPLVFVGNKEVVKNYA